VNHARLRYPAICAATLGATAIAASFTDFEDELRGQTFGGSVTKLAGVVDAGTRGRLQYYRRRDAGGERYGNVPLADVLFGFRDGKLDVVELWALGTSCDDDPLKHELTSRFGEPVYNAYGNEAWRQREGECVLLNPAECEVRQFQGRLARASATGVTAWHTTYFRYDRLDRLYSCRYRVRFSPSGRTP
jgi:hypothetical protein